MHSCSEVSTFLWCGLLLLPPGALLLLALFFWLALRVLSTRYVFSFHVSGQFFVPPMLVVWEIGSVVSEVLALCHTLFLRLFRIPLSSTISSYVFTIRSLLSSPRCTTTSCFSPSPSNRMDDDQLLVLPCETSRGYRPTPAL